MIFIVLAWPKAWLAEAKSLACRGQSLATIEAMLVLLRSPEKRRAGPELN